MEAAMPANNTIAIRRSVDRYVASIADEERRRDCNQILALMTRITKTKPKMWGPSIVGFGSYRYTSAAGREGEFMRIGFASRKGNLAIYLMASGQSQDTLLGKLGKHKMGSSCLTVRKLADIDLKVLERLIAGSFTEMRRRYPQ